MKKRLLFMISLLCAVAQGMLAQSHDIYYYELDVNHQYTNTRIVNVAEGEGYTIIEPSDPPSDRLFKGWVAVTGAPDANDDGLLQDGETLVQPGTILYMGSADLYYKARYVRKTDLSQINANQVITSGTTLTGTLANNVQISIADGATVTLRNVTINASGTWTTGSYAGITCNGDATIILEGTNTVKGFYEDYPGIKVPTSKTLTIQGDGSLYASSNGKAAGIGGGYNSYNYTNSDCGSIVIQGGTIVAEGGGNCPGIGAGGDGDSGNITITSGVNSVTALGGNTASRCIGGKHGYTDRGTVTIGGVVYFKDDSYQNNGENYIGQHALYFLKGNQGETGQYWTTYYDSGTNLLASEGTQVFKAALSGTDLTLTPISDRIVNSGQGAILKCNSDHFLLATSTNASSDNYDGNNLTGTMTAITNPNPGNVYVLNKKSAGVGFYKLKDSGTIGANKAYLVGPASAPEFLAFNETTGIKAIDNEQLTIDNEVYDLQGRRVQNPTKGLYIVNGKKVVIK